MYNWFGTSWIWILLGIGLLWFMFRRGGMGCGIAGHGAHEHEGAPAKELPPGDAATGPDQKREAQEPAAVTGRSRRHGGCC